MWNNYGVILAEYMFIKNFRTDSKYQNKIKIINKEILEKIINNKNLLFLFQDILAILN